jgi:peptide chain release factor 2
MFKSLTGKYDASSAHLSIFAGAGGDDAKDWANMLFEMYKKYAAKRGWKVVQTDDRDMEIRGEFAYGFLKKETGVHRLVRISPFSAKKLRHTSFALVEVVPVLPDLEHGKFRIPEEDIKMEFTRSSGPGGQNVNKRETAVRITHFPTGISVVSQAERSQAQNRERALKILKSKLFHLMETQQKKELSELRTKIKPEWGSQIRSYVLHPYKLVKDHRTKMQLHDPDAVLDGKLDKFIQAELEL